MSAELCLDTSPVELLILPLPSLRLERETVGESGVI